MGFTTSRIALASLVTVAAASLVGCTSEGRESVNGSTQAATPASPVQSPAPVATERQDSSTSGGTFDGVAYRLGGLGESIEWGQSLDGSPMWRTTLTDVGSDATRQVPFAPSAGEQIVVFELTWESLDAGIRVPFMFPEPRDGYTWPSMDRCQTWTSDWEPAEAVEFDLGQSRTVLATCAIPEELSSEDVLVWGAATDPDMPDDAVVEDHFVGFHGQDPASWEAQFRRLWDERRG